MYVRGSLVSVALILGVVSLVGQTQTVTYKLDPTWPKMPAGLYFGWKDTPPAPAEREAQSAARRQAREAGQQPPPSDPRQPGVSGLAIDTHDHVYAFNRGVKPVMVFDRDGNFVMAGAD